MQGKCLCGGKQCKIGQTCWKSNCAYVAQVVPNCLKGQLVLSPLNTTTFECSMCANGLTLLASSNQCVCGSSNAPCDAGFVCLRDKCEPCGINYCTECYTNDGVTAMCFTCAKNLTRNAQGLSCVCGTSNAPCAQDALCYYGVCRSCSSLAAQC